MISRSICRRAFSVSTRIRANSSFRPSDSSVNSDEITSENNPWSPSLEDDPVYIKESGKLFKTQLDEKYRLAYSPLYEAPAAKYVSMLKRLTLSVGFLGVYGAKLFYESTMFDDIYAYITLLGTFTPMAVVQYKTKHYATRIFRLYDKTKPQTLENLVNDEKLIIEKLNFTGSKTFNELLVLSNNKSLKLSDPPKFYLPYSTWKDGNREFYVLDNIGGIKMDRIWGIIEKNSNMEETKPSSASTPANKSSDRNKGIQFDDETVRNTQLNAEIFHTSNDSVDLYRQENNSSDLLGRLYYDDYDSDSILSPMQSMANTPLLLSPVISAESDSKPRPPLPRLKSMERGISFDTTPHGLQKSFTVKVKHPLFKFRRTNKTFLVGYNADRESSKAIEWLFDEMIINGDTIVILQVLDEKIHETIDKSKAEQNLAKFETLNQHFKKVKIIHQIVIGKAKKAIKNAVDEYRPSMMVIGTHHFDGKEHRSFVKSSLSKHILECSLVPVILVKPTYKYIEFLKQEVDGPHYFENWIKNIDDIENRVIRKKVSSVLSPAISRNSSYTSLVNEERGRSDHQNNNLIHESRSRSASKNRLFSRFFK
ncbi:SPBC25B2.10 Universal stress protein A family protein C25B2.10 [Candida maltosa Xu316]